MGEIFKVDDIFCADSNSFIFFVNLPEYELILTFFAECYNFLSFLHIIPGRGEMLRELFCMERKSMKRLIKEEEVFVLTLLKLWNLCVEN